MNTHSKVADGRMEVLSACAIRVQCDNDTALKILDCITMSMALEILKKSDILEKIMYRLRFGYRRCIAKKKQWQDSNWSNCIFK